MVMMMLMMLMMMMIGEEEKDKDKADQPILFTKSFSSLSLERFIVQVKQPKSEFNIWFFHRPNRNPTWIVSHLDWDWAPIPHW